MPNLSLHCTTTSQTSAIQVFELFIDLRYFEIQSPRLLDAAYQI